MPPESEYRSAGKRSEKYLRVFVTSASSGPLLQPAWTRRLFSPLLQPDQTDGGPVTGEAKHGTCCLIKSVLLLCICCLACLSCARPAGLVSSSEGEDRFDLNSVPCTNMRMIR